MKPNWNGDLSPCVEWDGATDPNGYGRVRDRATGKTKLAHRWIWEQANGAIPNGLVVMHLCDNPPCINVSHLKLGTQQENMHDAFAKGRYGGRLKGGAENQNAKFDLVGIQDVLLLKRQGLSNRRIAILSGVSHTTINGIISGKRYKVEAGI